MSDNTRHLITTAAAILILIIAVVVLVSCGVADKGNARRECENDGGTFIDKSGDQWECIYDRSNQ